jgi:CRISPR-associated endoribonuclease Cas6
MRLEIDLASENNQFRLPVQYNYFVQSAIYGALDRDFAAFLHNYGYDGGGRIFKLFSFSRLMGKYQVNNGTIVFEGNVKLFIVSPVEQFCQNILNGLLNQNGLTLGQAFLRIESIKADIPKVEEDRLKLRLLSPVVAYSTMLKPEGKKYTCFFQPGEKDFTENAAENLRKKYRAFCRREPPTGEIEIKPLQQPKLHVMEYKGTVIKGYSGTLSMKGPRELLQIALDAGLGSKNSMGFGCGERV